MEEEYYQQQIKGLIMILENGQGAIISRNYVKEKLNMILSGGINFHPNIKRMIEMKP